MSHNYDDMCVITDAAVDYWRLDTDVDEAANKAEPAITISSSGAGTAHDLLPAANNLHSNYFDGTADYITAVTSQYSQPTYGLAVECWIRPDADQSATSDIGLVVKSGAWGLELAYGKPSFFIWSHDGATKKQVTSSSTVSTGTNYHIVGTYAANLEGTPALDLYVNGSLVASDTAFTGFELYQDAANCTIGSWDTSVLFFHGWISNVALYGGLTSTQVSNHYGYSG